MFFLIIMRVTASPQIGTNNSVKLFQQELKYVYICTVLDGIFQHLLLYFCCLDDVS